VVADEVPDPLGKLDLLEQTINIFFSLEYSTTENKYSTICNYTSVCLILMFPILRGLKPDATVHQ